MDYRLYLLRNNRIQEALVFHAIDDTTALLEAAAKADSRAAELWCRARRVAKLAGL
jgi:hypothetical protein